MSYITSGDITDSIKNGFDSTVSALVLRADQELIAMARTQGVLENQIVEPIDYIIKQWLIAWVVKELCFEKIGKVSGLDRDKYLEKYNLYKERESEYRGKITPLMFTGNAFTQLDVAPICGQMLRG